VMLHADLPGVSPTHPEFARVKRYQVRDPSSGKPIGEGLDRPETEPARLAYIDPAAKAYRDILIAGLRPAVEDLRPDAIHLAHSGSMWNDANGLIEQKNFAQGSAALHRALLTAFPDVVLGGDSTNEVTAPFEWFAQRSIRGNLPPHPICAYLFGDRILTYACREQPNPDRSPAESQKYLTRFEIQGVSPTLSISGAADLAADKAGAQQTIHSAKVWQEFDFVPNWAVDWAGAIFRLIGAGGIEAVIETTPGGIRFRVGADVIYERKQDSAASTEQRRGP
jgi:hypothetical protein